MDDQQGENKNNEESNAVLPTTGIQEAMVPYGLNASQQTFTPRIAPNTLFQPIPHPAHLLAVQQAGRHSAPTVPNEAIAVPWIPVS